MVHPVDNVMNNFATVFLSNGIFQDHTPVHQRVSIRIAGLIAFNRGLSDYAASPFLGLFSVNSVNNRFAEHTMLKTMSLGWPPIQNHGERPNGNRSTQKDSIHHRKGKQAAY